MAWRTEHSVTRQLMCNFKSYRCSGLCNISRAAVYLHTANELSITIKLLIFIFPLPLLHLIFFQTATVHHKLADFSYAKCYVIEIILFLVLTDLDFQKNYLLSPSFYSGSCMVKNSRNLPVNLVCAVGQTEYYNI